MDGDTHMELPEIPGGRMKGEGIKPFQAFTVYRELGPSRTLEKTARALKKSPAYMAELSGRWDWRERIEQWDDYADLQLRKRDLVEREEARKAMNSDQAAIGNALMAVASKRLAMYDGENEKVKALLDAMTPGEIARLVQVGAHTQRLAMGETTERLEIREAAKFAERFVQVAETYIPEDRFESFLTDLDAVLGVGSLGGS